MPVSAKLIENRKKFVSAIEEQGLRQTLEYYSSVCHYSHSMLFDYLNRDYKEIVGSFSKKQVGDLLKKMGFKHDNKKYLKLPQHIKVQFLYPKSMSLDEIKIDVSNYSRVGAIKTCALRKTWKSYNKKNQDQYWINMGLTPEAAKEAAYHYRCSKSPYSKLFCKYKELSVLEKERRISKLAVARGLQGLIAQNYCQSNLEVKLHQALEQADIHFIKQKRIETTFQEQRAQNANNVYFYDIYIPERNLLIECNGTYWHADPRVYSESDILHYPGSVKMSASERWAMESVKLDIARKYGYQVKVFWEIDINDPQKLQSMIQEIKNV